jgi:hypothetical protein
MALKFELVWNVKIRKQRVVKFYAHVMSFGSDQDWYHGYLTASTQVAQGAPHPHLHTQGLDPSFRRL